MHIIKTDTPQGNPSGPPRVNDQSQSVAYSPCDSVQVISLKSGHSQKLPALVTLINSFLHFQTSTYVHQNLIFSSHLQGVVAHFASLGPIARQYLLKTRTLARLLRYLLTYNNSAPNLPPSQTNEQAFMYNAMPLIEIVNQQNEADRSSLLSSNQSGMHQDSKALQKERQQIAATMSSPMVFVIYTISLLVRSCQFVSSNSQQPSASINDSVVDA